MTPRSIRRAQERKARKELDRKARKELDRKTRNQLEHQAQTLAAETNCPNLSDVISDPDSTRYELELAPEVNRPTVSPAQLQANRTNAQLSTGPTSREGKSISSLNAVKTALTGRTILLPSDDAAAYQNHVQAFATDYAPVGPRESDLVQSLADTWWRLKRIPALEAALYAQGHLQLANAFDDHDPALRPSLIQSQTFLQYEKQFRNLQLQEARLYRRYEKDRAELRELQQARQQKEEEALQLAATRYQTACQDNQPYSLSANGFEFSLAQIEQHLATLPTRQTSHPPLRQTAQAA